MNENCFLSEKIFSGIDIVLIKRIRKSIEKDADFLVRFFGFEERLLFNVSNEEYRMERIAANFAAKEAFSKALQLGFDGFSPCEVQALRQENGVPYLYLTGKAKEIAESKNLQFSLSISHTDLMATAIVVAIKS